ncbi:Uncharacterized protein FWK35_00028060 [Aphis craccivora]|uniref:Uncharacterized protein n=1 Tax=Aphis craccivora TaxID=307492 RepID=A0A6G0VXE8_APHCR|nr:Uncharacterized protein FWK35_00028060 [Aphis craccivora]
MCSKMSALAFHLFVKTDRGGVLNIIVLYKDQELEPIKDEILLRNESDCSNSDFTTDDDNDNIPCKKITITLSPEEWRNQAKNYMTLPRGEWTHVIAEHFWEHTHLQYCLVLKQAKVYPIGEVVRKNSKRVTEKREFLRKTSFRPNRLFYMVVNQKLITFKFLRNLSKTRKCTIFHNAFEF